MGPRDPRDPSETNGTGNPGGKKKEKGKAKIPKNPSTDSFPNLTPEQVDKGIAALQDMGRIFLFAQSYPDAISTVEGIYGLHIDQQKRNEELETMVNELTIRKAHEMERLQAENEDYRATADQLERTREELEREQANMDDSRKAMQLEMERRKEEAIEKAKQKSLEENETKTKRIREEGAKKVKALEKKTEGLKDTIKELEANNEQAQNDLKRQRDSSDLDKRACQSLVKDLESKLEQINAASIVSPKKPEFYIESFRQLWERIQDVACNGFQFLPEDTRLLNSDKVKNQLFAASTIFRYHPVATESVVSTFLRRYAIQDYLSTKIISVIRRQYFVAPTPAAYNPEMQSVDWILYAISNVPAATSSQELSWRLTTVDKLDRLASNSPSAAATIATEPNQDAISKEILDQLCHFRNPSDQQLSAKVSEIASIAITLWSALRKDSCQVHFDDDPSTGDRQEWDLIEDVATSSAQAAILRPEIPADLRRSKPFVLFPRITGSFGSDGSSPRILHKGSALSHESPTLREGLLEIERIESETEQFLRRLRRGSSAQPSPAVGNFQGQWPVLHPGYD